MERNIFFRLFPERYGNLMKNKLYAAILCAVALLGINVSAAEKSVLPSDSLNVGDVLVASVRTHAALNGDSSVYGFEYSKKDYSDFAEYAIENGIVEKNEFASYTQTATKLDTAVILSRILPEDGYEQINGVYNIADISSTNEHYPDVLKMYRAGILTGDADKCFEPEKVITVSELSSAINRLVFPNKRIDTPDESIREEKQAYMLNHTDSMDGPKEGIESGWELDNRAGSLRTSLSGNGTLVDSMTDESSRLVRHFNVITDDKIDAKFRLRMSSGFNGNRIEFCDADGKPVYRIVCANDALNIENADGSLTKLCDRLSPTELYSFRVIIDFETGMSTTELNNVPLGEHPLIGDKIKYFAFVTSKDEKTILSIVDSFMYSNYTLYEDFRHYNAIPHDFETYGGVSLSGEAMVLKPIGTAYKRFNPVSGNVCFSFNTYMEQGTTGVEYSLMADGKAVVSLTVTDGNLYANGTLVKPNVSDKLWHKMRIEADTDTGKAVIKANAKVLATVPFAWNAKHFDEIKLYAGGITSVKVDDIKVYNIVDYDVPKPVIPGGDDNYIIGMNICSLWINGEHYGWGCVSPYEDITPVLGYYDEGIPECADWENKFMAEHGIDFQAFCWYASETNAPMKSTRLASQLDEAYLHSKYGDDVKFCLLWEAANASRPANSAAFRNYFVPYWIENYFTDPRYMTIDNKLVFSIFGADQLISAFGTGLKDEFDYMRNEVKKLGFDGMIITASHTGKNSLAAYGFDAWQAYNWGTSGYVLQNNINNNKNRASSKDVYVIPTVSVGFNSIPWHGIRYPLMTTADFKAAHEWIRDYYLPNYAFKTSETWNDKLVWLSTWNEYGEGTYIMPSDGLNGFGYLDALRDVYTTGGTHTDHVPSVEQKTHFNHLYPQDRRILRAYGNYTPPSGSVSDKLIDLTKSGVFDTNFSKGNLQSYLATGSNGTTLKSLDTGSNDAIIHFKGTAFSGFTADDINRIEVVASGIPQGSQMQMFFRTSDSPDLSEGNSVKSEVSEGTHEQTFILNLSAHKGFSGSLSYLRLDPFQKNGVTFTIKSIKIVAEKSMDMYINDRKLEFVIKPEYNATNDTWFVPFEPGKSFINFWLYVYHEWDYDTKVLKLYRDDKCVEFTVGSNKAKIDGNEYQLSSAVYQVDNIPMLPIEDLADIFGFGCELKNGAYYYTTPEKYIFDSYNDTAGQWNFDLFGSLGGWQADNVGVDYGDGTIIIRSDNGDPRFRTPTNGNLGIDISKYSKIEVRCRWENYNGSGTMGFYFTTTDSASESQDKFVGLSIVKKTDSFVTLTFNMTANSNWKGTLKSLRYDIFDAPGFCEVDYIKLVE